MRDVTWMEFRMRLIGLFLLTRPMRDVTSRMDDLAKGIVISTHTSHAGRDEQFSAFHKDNRDFYSHVPCGT